jgi:hypothetical protein
MTKNPSKRFKCSILDADTFPAVGFEKTVFPSALLEK